MDFRKLMSNSCISMNLKKKKYIYLFLGLYENTGLWHPWCQCWEAGWKSCSSSWWIWDMPGVFQDIRSECAGDMRCTLQLVEETSNTYFDPVALAFLYALLKQFFTKYLFFYGASVYITASGRHFRNHIPIWFRVFRMHIILLRSSETFNSDTLCISFL